MIRRRSAGPLISKFLKRELARKRSRVSSMMSASSGLAAPHIGGQRYCVVAVQRWKTDSHCGAGPLILVRIGNTAVLPTSRVSGYSLNDEW